MKSRVPQIILFMSTAAFSCAQSGGAGGVPGVPGGGNKSAAADAAKDGFHLYDVSLFGGYSSSANPLTETATPQAGSLGSDENYGASFDVGWQHHREKDNFSINYNGSYSANAHYTSANYYSQWLVLSTDRK